MTSTWDTTVQMLIDGAWEDITRLDDETRVLGPSGRDGVTIESGASSEQGEASPLSMRMTLLDNDGTFNTSNPLSPYYGKLGRNTPVRVRTVPAGDPILVSDAFTRTTSNGWGTSTGGGPWSVGGSGGTLAYSQFATGGSSATMAVDAASAYRLAILRQTRLASVEVYAECAVALATGGALEPTLLLLYNATPDGTDAFMARVLVNTDNSVGVVLLQVDDSVQSTLASATTTLTHAAATPLKIRAQYIYADSGMDPTFQMKVWQGGSEPGSYTVIATPAFTNAPLRRAAAGPVGVRSGVASGNTNVKPVTFTWDNVQIRDLGARATGEIVSWRPSWVNNADGGVVMVADVEAVGVLQRLQRPQASLQSVAYRGLTSSIDSSYLVAYWPIEEKSGASPTTLFTPYSTTGAVAYPINGLVDPFPYGSYTDHPASERMLSFSVDQRIDAYLPTYTNTGETKIFALWSIPSGLSGTERQLYRIYTSGGSFDYVDLVLNVVGGTIGLNAWSGGSVTKSSSGGYFSDLIGEPVAIGVEFVESGGSVLTHVYTYGPTNIGDVSATWTTSTFGVVTKITVGDRRISAVSDLETISFGHFAIAKDTSAFSKLVSSTAPYGFRGYVGETAGARFARLCEEEGQDYVLAGTASASEAMGAQTPDTFYNLLSGCVATDQGVMFEPRDSLAIGMRTRRNMCGQRSLPLSYPSGHLSGDFLPVDDDRFLSNDVTVSRPDGGSGRYVIPNGDLEHLSTEDPPSGAGRYAETRTLNAYTDDRLTFLAQWNAHVSSWRGQRYPSVEVDLARSDLENDPATCVAMRGVSMGDILEITTTGMPGWVSENPAKLLVRGSVETISKLSHRFRFNCAPGYPYDTSVYIDTGGLVNALLSRRDTDVSKLSGAHNSSTTTLTVESSGGIVWTTTSADWDATISGGGLYIEVGGEIMQVTNITGASSPQTFTVTRSVNGIVKSHADDTPVRAAYPARRAL
jgi:hypothetical protein